MVCARHARTWQDTSQRTYDDSGPNQDSICTVSMAVHVGCVPDISQQPLVSTHFCVQQPTISLTSTAEVLATHMLRSKRTLWCSLLKSDGGDLCMPFSFRQHSERALSGHEPCLPPMVCNSREALHGRLRMRDVVLCKLCPLMAMSVLQGIPHALRTSAVSMPCVMQMRALPRPTVPQEPKETNLHL